MKSLVTGAAGFIGSTLVERLLDIGHEVIGLDCFTDYYSVETKKLNLSLALDSDRYTFACADLAEADLEPLLEGIDWVFHQAAQPGVRMSWGKSFESYLRNNVLATQRLLEAAKHTNIRRFVYASSSSVYGEAGEMPVGESTVPQPISPYGVTKLAGEHLCRLYHLSYGVPTVCLRYFTVYGPRQRPDMAFHRFIRSALLGEEITVYGDGEQTRDFTYVSDVVTANILAGKHEQATGKVFNIGGGSSISINDVLEIIGSITGKLKVRHAEEQKGDVRHTMSDTIAAREILGYAPEVGIAEGIGRQIEWLKDQVASSEPASPASKAA